MRTCLYGPLAGVAVVCLFAGCRDFRDTEGLRFADRHVMAGRPQSRGGPRLRDVELQRGWAELRDEDLTPLRDMLRSSLGLRVRVAIDARNDAHDHPGPELPGFATLRGLGSTVVPGPEYEVEELRDVDFSQELAPSLDTQQLLDDLDKACQLTLLPRDTLRSACGAVNFNLGVDYNPIDEVEMDVDFAGAELHWVPPTRFHFASTTKNESDRPLSAGRGERAGCRTDEDCAAGLRCDPSIGVGVCTCDAERRCPSMHVCSLNPVFGPDAGTCAWEQVECRSDADCATHRPTGATDAAHCDLGRRLCTTRVDWSWEQDASLEHPVLAIDTDLTRVSDQPDVAIALLLFRVRLDRIKTRVRLQAQPPQAGGIAAPRRVFADYRAVGPAGDLYDAGDGLQISARGELLEHSVDITPIGALCHATLGIACIAIESEVRAKLDVGLRGISRAVGNLVGALPAQPRLSRFGGASALDDTIEAIILQETFDARAPLPVEQQPPTDRDGATTRAAWIEAFARATRNDRAHTYIELENSSELAPLLGATDAFTSSFSRILSRGGRLAQFGLDAAPLAALCGPDPRIEIGGLCADASSTMPECIICRGCLGSSSALCDFSGPAVLVQANEVGLFGNRLRFSAMPELARVVDTLFNTSEQIRALYTNVLDRLAPPYRRFTDIAYCEGEALPRCPVEYRGAPAGPRVVVRFGVDADLDGVPAGYDGCPNDPALSLRTPDRDADGHADSCDLCPLIDRPQYDTDGDGRGDECDCDIDGDGCNQSSVSVPSHPPSADFQTQCVLTGESFDVRPLRSDEGRDPDRDGHTNDCDHDDDNDTVPDRGVGPGARSDNCPETPNTRQTDRNGDGVGDACDLLCNASTPAWRCTNPQDGRVEPVPDIDLGPGIDPGCIRCATLRATNDFDYRSIEGVVTIPSPGVTRAPP